MTLIGNMADDDPHTPDKQFYDFQYCTRSKARDLQRIPSGSHIEYSFQQDLDTKHKPADYAVSPEAQFPAFREMFLVESVEILRIDL